MTKVFKKLLIVTMSLSLIFGFTTSISAENSTQQEIFSTKIVDKTIISSSPNVPDYITFDDYIGGKHYWGLLYYQSQAYNPDVGYLTHYRGTVYLQ